MKLAAHIERQTSEDTWHLTSLVFAAAVVVLPLVFERQLVAQRRGQSQQAGSAGPGGQGGLQPCRVRRERDGDCVTVGEVLRLELLLLEKTETEKKKPRPLDAGARCSGSFSWNPATVCACRCAHAVHPLL